MKLGGLWFAEIRMNLKCIIQSEVSQKEGNKCVLTVGGGDLVTKSCPTLVTL